MNNNNGTFSNDKVIAPRKVDLVKTLRAYVEKMFKEVQGIKILLLDRCTVSNGKIFISLLQQFILLGHFCFFVRVCVDWND